MAKNQISKPVNGKATVTAATYIPAGKGKPKRPDGMSNAEWVKVLINIRVPRVLKMLDGIARLSTVKGFAELPKTNARILRDLQSRMDVINTAFATPTPNKGIKKHDAPYTV